MAFTTKGKTTIVEEETHKLTKQDIEFLLNIVENSMVPGKYIGLANHVIGKLRNQYQMHLLEFFFQSSLILSMNY